MWFDWISAVSAIVAIIAAIITALLSHKANNLNGGALIVQIYELECENKKLLNKYEEGLKSLKTWVLNNKNFTFDCFMEELGKQDYDNIRGIMYFYEYLGSIVKMRQISFKQVFSIVLFPDKFNESIDPIKKAVKEKRPDFLENYDYLRMRYEKERRKRFGK